MTWRVRRGDAREARRCGRAQRSFNRWRLVEESSKAPARVWRDTFARLLTFDDQAKLGRMVAPTLVVWGEHDALFADRAEQERLATTIPDAQLIVFNDTGHSPNWERPEAVAHEIQGFTAARK